MSFTDDDMKRLWYNLFKDAMADTELAVGLLRRVLAGEMENEIYWEVKEFVENWDEAGKCIDVKNESRLNEN